MPRVAAFILCTLILCGSSSIADAATDTSFRIFDWLGHVSWNKQEKQLDHCSAQLTNADKINIIYSLDRQYIWGLEISSPAWNFTKGASFPVTVKVGDRGILRFRAVANEAQLVQLQLPDSLTVFDLFRRAIQLEIAAGGLTSHFDLTYGPQVLMALTKCVARYGTSSRDHAEISAWLKSFASTHSNTGTDASLHNEAVALAADIMTEAQFPIASSLSPNDVPGLTGDAFWKIGNIVFTVSIMSQAGVPAVDNLARLIIGSEAAKCRGDLFSGAAIDLVATLRVARAITSCATPQAVTTIYYLAIPRRQGGIYLLATITNSFDIAALGEQTAEDVDGKVRNSISVALSKLNASKQ